MNITKWVRTALLIMCLALLTTGCGSAATSSSPATTERKPGSLDFPLLDYSIPSKYPADMSEVVDFTFQTSRKTYPTNVETIEITIENLADVDRMTGAPYALEIFRDNGWYSVPYKKLDNHVTRAWPAIAYFVPAKDKWTGSVHLTEYDSLKTGHYRIVKEVTSVQLSEGFSVFLSAEFDISSITGSDPNLMAGIRPADRPDHPEEPSRPFLDAVHAFSWSLFREAATPDKTNPVLSPASVYFALAMTLNGADGATRQAMLDALSAKNLSLDGFNRACRDWMINLTAKTDKTDLKIRNSIWFNDGFSADPDFLKTNADFHSAAAYQVDFADSQTVSTINRWVRDATDNKIRQIIHETSEADLLYLINAVYFKSLWKNRFISALTQQGLFYAQKGEVQASFMKRTGEVTYLVDQSLRGVLLPFVDPRFSFFAILPEPDKSARDLAGRMDATAFGHLMQTARLNEFTLLLPAFEVEFDTSLVDPLTNLGMGMAFREDADFSLMDRNRGKGLFISGVGHKAFFKIDESGAEAAAVTGVTMAGSAPMEKPILSFNRPFIYGILDNVSEVPLFIGILDNPENAR